MTSVPNPPGGLSIDVRPWTVTVIMILVIVWAPAAQVASAYGTAVTVAGLFGATCCTAAKYRNRRNR
ncbi:hypothetical protein [Streptomyces sp. NPDC054786]